jgi:phytoene dehydrogenase-like protein
MKTDAIVIGSGPNGLAAAITLGEAGHSVVVYEAESSIGGGMRSAQLTLPGFVHDVCAAVHPMAESSECFRRLNLEKYGLRWIFPEAELAHPFDDGTAILITRSLAETSAQFGPDALLVRQLLEPLVNHWKQLAGDILRPARVPRHPWLASRFALNAIYSADALAQRKFGSMKTRAVFAGLAAHSEMPLTAWGSAAFGILLWTTCHAVGWPIAAGGSQSIANALARHFEHLGGKIIPGTRIQSLSELPKSSVVLCDLTPRQFLKISADRLSPDDQRKLQAYRYGPGAFKIDWSLDAPIPWNAPECSKAGTVHLGGTLDEIVQSERAAWSEAPAEKPFVLLAQPSLFDPSRAPKGKHTAWAYCHVPHASTVNMVERIEQQVERFAPGFSSHVIGRSVMSPADLEAHDANLIGGDISGGAISLDRLVRRSTSASYRTPIPNVFLCSASTPPGPGVHGLCGYFAAKFAQEKTFRKRSA